MPPLYFVLNTLLACAGFYVGTLGDAPIFTFATCAGSFLLGHIATELLNYNETKQTKE